MTKQFSRELMEAERFGPLAVRETVSTVIEKCQLNTDRLTDLSVALLQAADRVHNRNDDEMTGTYLFLYYNLWDYAREHLSSRNYHLFCEKQNGFELYWYL